MEILTELMNEMSTEIDPALLVGAAAGIGVMILQIILGNKGIIMAKGAKRLARAKAQGHVLEGNLEDCWYETRENEGGTTRYVYHARYNYFFEGKKYIKKTISYHGHPSQRVSLYYEDDPSKAYLEEEMTRQPVGGCLIILVPLVTAIIVAMLCGYRG